MSVTVVIIEEHRVVEAYQLFAEQVEVMGAAGPLTLYV
jgi:hypothetical protein